MAGIRTVLSGLNIFALYEIEAMAVGLYETQDETPAVEPSDQTSKTVRHVPLVYRVEEIAQLLAISNRAAYNLCNTTKDFKVIRLGTSIRVSKQSFDDWFAAV